MHVKVFARIDSESYVNNTSLDIKMIHEVLRKQKFWQIFYLCQHYSTL